MNNAMVRVAGMGGGLLAVFCFLSFASTVFRQQDAPHRIKDIRCDERRKVGRVIRVQVRIMSEGSTDPGTVLTVRGLQGGAQIFSADEDVFVEPGKEAAEETFFYTPVTGGEIQWEALVAGDQAFCTTDVPPGGSDDNEPPVAYDQAISMDVDVPAAITLTASDKDGDTLTLFVLANPANGALSGSAPNLTYRPNAGYSGPDSFTFKAHDGMAESDTAKVSLTVDEHAERDEHEEDDEDGGGVGVNLIAAHDSGSRHRDRDCTDSGCHANILAEQSLDPTIPNIHVAMLPNTPGENNRDRCIFCHRTVDLRSGGLERTLTVNLRSMGLERMFVRKRVNPGLCAFCHSPAGPGRQLYQTGRSLDAPSGAALYELLCSGCHRSLANTELGGERASEIREALDENEGGMGPLGFLTDQEIAAIAAMLAEGEEEGH